MRRWLRAMAWLGGLVAAGMALRVAATGDLAAPPLGSWSALLDWVDARDPVVAAVALARLVAEVSVWYVVAVSVLHVVGAGLRLAGAHSVADALAVPAVGRLVRAGLGMSVVAASTLSPASAAGPPRAATMATAGIGTAVAAPSEGAAVMRPAPAPPEVAAAPIAVPAPVAVPTTWTVEPGDSFWTIAEEALADALGRPPSGAEVHPYWRRLVEANRARLVDADDPDLLHAGQVLELPPLP